MFDLVYYTGESDQDRMDNADGVAHVYYAADAEQTWNWGITSATWSSTAPNSAISFK